MEEEKNEKPVMEDMLRHEIAAQIEFLNGLEPGTKEHTAAANDVATLLKALYADLEQEVVYETKMKEFENKQTQLESEQKQFEQEIEFKKEQFEKETDLKQKQFEEDIKLRREQLKTEQKVHVEEKKERNKDRILDTVFKGISVVVGIAGLVVPYHFYKKMYLTGLEFEKDNCISSQHSKWLIGRIKPGKLE